MARVFERVFEVVHAVFEAEDVARSALEEIGLEDIAAHHLEREAAEISHRLLPCPKQAPPLASQPADIRRLGRATRILERAEARIRGRATGWRILIA